MEKQGMCVANGVNQTKRCIRKSSTDKLKCSIDTVTNSNKLASTKRIPKKENKKKTGNVKHIISDSKNDVNGSHRRRCAHALSKKALLRRKEQTKKWKLKMKERRKKKRKSDSAESGVAEKLPSPVPPVLVQQTNDPSTVSANWAALQQTLKPGRANWKRTKQGIDSLAADNSTDQAKIRETDIWFDDVDEDLLEKPALASQSQEVSRGLNARPCKGLVKENAATGLTKRVAIDCEMVGVGPTGQDSILARVSLVNEHGHQLYDKYVKPKEKVTDYRTAVSGIRPQMLKNAELFEIVQKEVADIINGRILVGHALHHDLGVLFLDHPKKKIRDTSLYKPFRKALGSGGLPSLKKLTAKLLNVTVQAGEHNSVEDAQAAMRLYTMHKKEWEKSLKGARHKEKAKLNKSL